MQARHQPIGGESEIRGHLQHFMLLLSADCAQSCVDILQTEGNLLEQQGANLCQLDTPVNPVEQARTELLFQTFHLLADRRLRGAKLHRSSGKTAMAGRRFKSAQQIEGEVTEGVIHKLYLS